MLPAVFRFVARQCLQLLLRGASFSPLDAETLPASSIESPAQPVHITVFLLWSMFDPVGKLIQDFKPLCNLAGGFSSLAQPNQ